MANGIDPRLALAAVPGATINPVQRFSSNILNLERAQQAPLQTRALERREEEETNPLNRMNRRDQARTRSLVNFATEVKPLVDAGNFEAVRQAADARRQRLVDLNIDTREVDQFISALDRDPEMARNQVEQTLQLGQLTGLIERPPQAGAEQRRFQSLVEQAQGAG